MPCGTHTVSHKNHMPNNITPPTIVQKMFRWIGMQHWLRLGIRYRILRLMKKTGQKFIVPFGRYTYSGSLDNYIDWHVFFYGAYEQPELDLLSSLIDTSSVVFDVGANSGNHTLFFAERAARVYSFEPFPSMVERLRTQMGQNAITTVTIMPFGLGAARTERTFFAPSAHNQGMGSFTGQYAPTDATTMTLPIQRGDDVARELDLARLDLVKIDVEGLESEVLAGLQDTVARLRPILFVEFSMAHGMQRTLAEIQAYLPPQYRAYASRGHRATWLFFNKRGCSLTPLETGLLAGNILFVPEESEERIAAYREPRRH